MELSIYLGRMPILDARGENFAYELLHRSTPINHTTIDDNKQATARVLVNALNYIGLESLTGYKPAFVKLDENALYDDLILCISPQYFILEILERPIMSPELIKRVKYLKDKGYNFALRYFEDDMSFNDIFEDIFPYISYIKIDTKKFAKEKIVSILQKLSFIKIDCIAEKVEDMEDFEWAKEVGFKYFEGYYFSKPQIYIKEMIDPDSQTLLKLLYILKNGSDLEELLNIFNSSTYLSINVLKFIHLHHKDENSPISTIEQALIILGRKKLSHWVELMIYAQRHEKHDEDNISISLGKIARSRACLMEELAILIADRSEPHLASSAYLVGILSLAETMFQSNFEKIFIQMDLDPLIASALHKKEGVLGDLFKLCLAVESNYFEEINDLLPLLDITQSELNKAMVRSYQKASQL